MDFLSSATNRKNILRSNASPFSTASNRAFPAPFFGRFTLGLSGCLTQLLQIVRPSLHHDPTLLQELSAVVRAAKAVFH